MGKKLNKKKKKSGPGHYSPTKDRPFFDIYVTGQRGSWRANFKIGVQHFHVCDRETKKEAVWFCKCLHAAFHNLSSKSAQDTEANRKLAKEFLVKNSPMAANYQPRC